MAGKEHLHQSITVTLDDGSEKQMEILLTYKDKETDRDYVLYYDYNSDDDKVYAFRYDDAGNLFQVETDDEWEVIERVFRAYMDEENDMEGEE